MTRQLQGAAAEKERWDSKITRSERMRRMDPGR
jgi:hypothetical protein